MTHRAAILFLVFTVGCSSTYYATMEKMGWEKRDLLVSRVEAARDSQDQAKTEFKDALEQFRSVVKVESGKLEESYDKVRAAYEDADARATDVRNRVDAVENVGGALFREWSDEIEGMKDAGLRTRSRQLRKDSLGRYERMLAAMKKAAGSMTPVLDTMRDQVTFMKHNLNAKAVNAMRGSLADIEGDVGRLLKDMERSIAEADAFISDLGSQ